MYTPFWYTQPSVLYEQSNLFEIFPVKEYDSVRKLNAVFRFSVYYSLIVYLYKRNTDILAIPVITAFVTYLMWKHNSDIQNDVVDVQLRNDKPIEGSEKAPTLITLKQHNMGCDLPTKDNPFMNTPFFDVAADKELPKSCTSYDNKGIQRQIEKKFDKGLYKNYTDVFGKENSQRQFFTVPGREGIPDQGSFAKWLYRTPDTCKEGFNPLACTAYRR